MSKVACCIERKPQRSHFSSFCILLWWVPLLIVTSQHWLIGCPSTQNDLDPTLNINFDLTICFIYLSHSHLLLNPKILSTPSSFHFRHLPPIYTFFSMEFKGTSSWLFSKSFMFNGVVMHILRMSKGFIDNVISLTNVDCFQRWYDRENNILKLS